MKTNTHRRYCRWLMLAGVMEFSKCLKSLSGPSEKRKGGGHKVRKTAAGKLESFSTVHRGKANRQRFTALIGDFLLPQLIFVLLSEILLSPKVPELGKTKSQRNGSREVKRGGEKVGSLASLLRSHLEKASLINLSSLSPGSRPPALHASSSPDLEKHLLH